MKTHRQSKQNPEEDIIAHECPKTGRKGADR